MDFNLKQCRVQQQEPEFEQQQQQQQSAKIPRQFLFDFPQQQKQEVAALPLFASAESQSNKMSTTHLSACSDHSSTPTAIPTRLPRVGGRYSFSMAQWQELELQALIYRHMVAGETIPSELLHLVKKSLFTSSSSSYCLHPYSSPFQSVALLQAGYWGKAVDPEPGRCRRTDGKKWRCSRDVVAGHKYCERHMNRGRNRSRKPVEFPSSAGNVASGGDVAVVDSLNKSSSTPFAAGSIADGGCGVAHFSLSRSGGSTFDAFLNTGRSAESRSDKKTLSGAEHNNSASEDGKSNNKVLMHFFDDWPSSLQDCETGDANHNLSSTSLSISTPRNPTSDFLRLSTGNGDELGRRDGNQDREHNRVSWTGGWGGNTAASMGGPLAEALRSSNTSSPTSVLHQLRRSAPDNSYVIA